MEKNSVGNSSLMNPLLNELNNTVAIKAYTKYTSKTSQIEPSTSESLSHEINQFKQPSSRLEHIEKFLMNTKNCEASATTPTINNSIAAKARAKVANLHSSSGFMNTTNPNTVLNSQNCCNKILNNLVLFDEPKIFSLQRSISEKLRNSFKSTSNTINLLNNTQVDKEANQLNQIFPRKWHSERCRTSNKTLNVNSYTKPPSSRFSTQVPLNNHHKTILAQYANKARQEKLQNTDMNQKSQNSKIKLKLNKKFSYAMRNNKKLSSQFDVNSHDKKAHYMHMDNELNNDDDSSCSSSSSTDTDVEDNDIKQAKNSKEKRKLNYLKMIKYREGKSLVGKNGERDDDSNDTDADSEASLSEAVNFDFNSRMDFIRDRYLDLDGNDIELLGASAEIIRQESNNSHELFYERVICETAECIICCEDQYLNERQCCQFRVCNNCINTYIQTQIKECYGSIRIECLNNKCNKLIHRDEINERMTRFDKDALKIYLKFLVDANKDSNCKTCPRCSHVMAITNANEIKKRPSRSKLKFYNVSKPTKVQCKECQLVWCFQCHAPWHDGITCGEFRKGDRMLKYWANEVHYGQQNAQLCPKCKIYIQRTKGCDHMVCTFCHTDFCYKCGGRFRRFKFLGDHYSKLSILGCKYKFYPMKPAKRRLIRGSILCGKILATPVLISVGVVIGACALVVGSIALPTYGSYKIIKHIQKNHQNQQEEHVIVNDIICQNVKNEEVNAVKNTSQASKFTELNLIPREATTGSKIVEINSSNRNRSNSSSV